MQIRYNRGIRLDDIGLWLDAQIVAARRHLRQHHAPPA